jgi:hypothetical protein
LRVEQLSPSVARRGAWVKVYLSRVPGARRDPAATPVAPAPGRAERLAAALRYRVDSVAVVSTTHVATRTCENDSVAIGHRPHSSWSNIDLRYPAAICRLSRARPSPLAAHRSEYLRATSPGAWSHFLWMMRRYEDPPSDDHNSPRDVAMNNAVLDWTKSLSSSIGARPSWKNREGCPAEARSREGIACNRMYRRAARWIWHRQSR